MVVAEQYFRLHVFCIQCLGRAVPHVQTKGYTSVCGGIARQIAITARVGVFCWKLVEYVEAVIGYKIKITWF